MYLQIAGMLMLAATDASTDSPQIAVDGTGIVKTEPDVATISFSIRGEGQTSDLAASNLVARSSSIERALRSVDPAIDLHDSDLRIVAARGAACKDGSDDDNGNRVAQMSIGPCAVVGYRASKDATVKTSKISDAGTMVGVASRQGTLNASIEDFALRNPHPAEREALSQAFADALAKAQTLAAAGHFRVGRILSASTDGARGNDIVVTAGRREVPAMAMAPPPVPISLTPLPVQTTATVHVTYAIEP